MQRFILSFTIAIAALSFCNQSFAEDLEFLRPFPEHPMYQLSNLRVEKTSLGLRKILVFDFKRTRKGKGTVTLQGRNSQGPLRLSLPSGALDKDSGTIGLDIGFSFTDEVPNNFELWLKTNISLLKSNETCKLSNTIRRGSVSGSIKVHPVTEEHITARNEFQNETRIRRTAPASLPENMVAVTDSTNLIPGMPIKCGDRGEWFDAEVIKIRDSGYVLVKYNNLKEGMATKSRSRWLAISPSVLEQGRTSPESFTPSVRVLGNGTTPIPSDTQPVPDATKLVLGTPVTVKHFNKWNEGVIVKIISNQKFEVIIANWRWALDVERDEFLVKDSTVQELLQPQIEKKYAQNLPKPKEDMKPKEDTKSSMRSGGILRDRPIRIPVPDDCTIVTNDMLLNVGTPLAFCWGNKWRLATVQEQRDDELVLVKSDLSRALDGYVKREQLIIQLKTLKKLQAIQKTNQYLELRTWTDSSGTYKIPAKYLSSSLTKVKLLREDGTEISLAITKLSVEDQQIIKEIRNLQD